MEKPDQADTGVESSAERRARICRIERLRNIRRLFVVGDVQSNYTALMATLAEAGFATERNGLPAWTGGDAALLFLGDLLDGGSEPARVIWLLVLLFEQAQAEGGWVGLVQGNHEMMLLDVAEANEEQLPGALGRWFANGGFETLLRLAVAAGLPVTEPLIAQLYTAVLGNAEDDRGVQELTVAVFSEFSREIAVLKQTLSAAVLVNGVLLAVHAAPNFNANLDNFVASAGDEIQLAWSRSWLEDWSPGASAGPFVERIAALKRHVDDPRQGIDLRSLLFAHTPLAAFAAPGFRDRQYRVGRLIGPEIRPDLPAVYALLTTPREVAVGGALGGLLFDGEGITAIYGNEMRSEACLLPKRQRLDAPIGAFARIDFA